MANIKEIFNTNELINYFKEKTNAPMLGEQLFPAKKIPDIEFDMILGKGGLPVSANVHAFDTETELASRQAIEKGAAALALIKRKIKISEKDLIKIKNPRNDAELNFVIEHLYNDAETMVESVNVRAEAMRMELLSSGAIAINENGVAVTLNYGVPSGNKQSFTWSALATAKPLEDLIKLADAVENTSGVRPTRAITSRAVIRTICSCESIKEAIHGVNATKIVTARELNDLLERCDLPTLVAYEEKYKVQTAKGYTTKRYFPNNKIAMFGPDTLGESIFGLTAEEVELMGDAQMASAFMENNVFVGTYKSIDPVGHFTKAATTFLPSFPHADELGIATITLPS